MARPQKNGLLYFPLDVDFFSNKKIKSLKARYGGDGIMFYLYLLTEIYHNGYYIGWDADSEDNTIDDLHLTEGFIKQVLTFLTGRSLLTSITTGTDTILTSPGIQKRYQEAVKGLKRDVYVDPDIWLLKSEDTAPFIKFTHEQGLSEKNSSLSEKNNSKSGKNPLNKIKRNEIKENNKGIPPLWYPEDEKLNQTLSDFIEFRKGIKAEMADHSIELLIKKLDSMTSVSNEKIQILEQSMINGWKGIFPLDKSSTSNKSVPKVNKTKFTNYEEREWDYEELEKIKQAELMKGVNAGNA